MSEKTLDNLITTLKAEAIDKAEKEAAAIVKTAQEKAERMLYDAREQQKQLLEDAEKKVQVTLQKGESALRQAARDVTVTLRNDIIQLLKAMLNKDIEVNFTPELLRSAIVEVITNIGGNVELKLAANFTEGLSDYVVKRLQVPGQLIAISKDADLSKGFSIIERDQGWRYDISPETVTEVLYEHLSGRWVNMLKTELKK